MKIAQISATFPPYMAGTGNVCYHYSIELAKLGHEVTVFTSRYPDEEYKYPDLIKVRRFKPLFRVGNAPFIPQLLGINNFDIIHLHFPLFFGDGMVYLLYKLKKQKYIITYHNDVILNGIMAGISNVYINTIMKLAIKNARKICVTSLDYAQHSSIQNLANNGDERIVEVPNGVDIDQFNPNVDGITIKKKHGILNKKVILFVGALDTPHFFKGINYLLKCFARINNKNINLIVVGDGDLKNHYMDIARREGIEDKTIFTGRVSNEDLPKYYAASDLTILPSITMGEAFGMVLIEAMATGKPVIASNLPGIRTVVDDGKNGYLIEPKDVEMLASRLQYLLENDDICRVFGTHGRKKVEEKYSWVQIGAKLEQIYSEVVY